MIVKYYRYCWTYSKLFEHTSLFEHLNMSIENRLHSLVSELLIFVDGIHANKAYIGLSPASENLYTLVLAAEDVRFSDILHLISLGIFNYCLYDIDLLLTSEMQCNASPSDMSDWIGGDVIGTIDLAVRTVASHHPALRPLAIYILDRSHLTCPLSWISPTFLSTVQHNCRRADFPACIQACKTLLSGAVDQVIIDKIPSGYSVESHNTAGFNRI